LFLRFQSYGEAKPSGENFIDCELLAKVKTPAFSNEFISSMLDARCKTAAAEGFRVRRRAHAEHLFTKLIGRRCLRRFGARWSQTLI
jgi:hypothetical protein